jgi:hypothetical protein
MPDGNQYAREDSAELHDFGRGPGYGVLVDPEEGEVTKDSGFAVALLLDPGGREADVRQVLH